MSTDPLSDILKLTNATTVASGGITAGGAWAIRFPEMAKMKFVAIVQGGCWLYVDGQAQHIRIETGDVLLLTTQSGFILKGDAVAAPIDAMTVFGSSSNHFVQLGIGEDCRLIGGFVLLDPASGALLRDVLPALIHIQSSAAEASVLRWLLEQFVLERELQLLGGSLAASQLAQLMFIQILRLHLTQSDHLKTGWLRALSHPRIAPALRLMHADPARTWQLEELAQATAMSRTTFALHFKAAAGVAPLTYLTTWRMHLAQQALREGQVSLAILASSLGYASESALSNAFKRVTGVSPTHYRAAVRAAQATGLAEH